MEARGAVEARGERRRIIGVMGSGVERHEALAVPLGRWIAERGYHLLTGGGAGVMEAVGEGFASVAGRRGLSIGILPAGPPPGYPNRWVDIAIHTHLEALGDEGEAPRSRNHLNVLSSDVVVALPGGAGTRSEVALAVRYGRPLVRMVAGGGAGAAQAGGGGSGGAAASAALPDVPGAPPAVASLSALFEALVRARGRASGA
jgi:uncharacterized protein (TIGR00725 family)